MSWSWKYLRLKPTAVFVRTFIVAAGQGSRLLRGPNDWQAVYHKASREYTIPSSKTPGTVIKIRVWDPPNVSKAAKRPVHINFHGSGFVIPLLGADSDFCQLVSSKLGVTVLDCDYLKAPEYPFPHAYNQILDVLNHVLASSEYDTTKVTMGGFSAGAALALTTAANERLMQNHVRGIVSMYAPTDLSGVLPDSVPGPPGSTAMPLTPSIVALFNDAYSIGGYPLSDPRISALKADWSAFAKSKAKVEGKPQVVMIGGEHDELTRDAEWCVEKMRKEGVEVEWHLIKDAGHAWDKSARPNTWEYERKAEAYGYAVEFLRGMYA